MLQRTFAACATLLALSAQANMASAGEFNASHIPKDASWFAHLDFEAGADSKIFKELTASEKPNEASRLANWLTARYGIEAEKLDGLTLYSLGSEDTKTVALLYGNINEQKLLETVKAQAEVSSREVGNATYHTWTVNANRSARADNNQPEQPASTSPGQTRANQPQNDQSRNTRNSVNEPGARQNQTDLAAGTRGAREQTVITAVFKEDVAIFAKDFNTAEQAVNTLDNRQGLDTSDKLRVQKGVPGEVLLQVVVLNIADTSRSAQWRTGQSNPAQNIQTPDNQNSQRNGRKDAWAVMDEVDTVSLAIGELNEMQAFVAVEAKAKSEQSAQKVNEVLEGLRALAALSESDDNKFNLGALEPDVDQEGAFLRMKWTLEIEQVSDMLNRQLERNNSRPEPAKTAIPVRPGTSR